MLLVYYSGIVKAKGWHELPDYRWDNGGTRRSSRPP